MSDQAFPDTYTTHTTTTTTTAEVTVGPKLDLDYLKALPGWLKIAEIILSLLAFICTCSAYDIGGRAGWSGFVTFTAFLITIVLLCVFLFRVNELVPKVPWTLVELGYYVLWSFFLVISFFCMAVLASYLIWSKGAAIAATIFILADCAVFLFDAFLHFKSWRALSSTPTAAA